MKSGGAVMIGRDCSDSLNLLRIQKLGRIFVTRTEHGSIGLIISLQVKIRLKLLRRVAFPVVDLSY
jgi:hypothetical protein